MIDARIYVLVPEGQEIFISNDLFVPLSVGNNCKKNSVDSSILNDHNGNNISQYYERWGNLTGLYWIWKNTSHEKVGVMTRRRFLSLAGGWQKDSSVSNCNYATIRRNRWSLKAAAPLLSKVDIVHPYIYCVEDITVSQEVRTPYQFYQNEGGSIESVHIILEIIKEKFPHFYIDAVEFIYGNKMIPWNNFIMSRDIFNEYCDFVFSVMFCLDEKNHLENNISFQRNIYCLIAEILGNIYLKYLRKRKPHLSSLEAPLVYIEGSHEYFLYKDVVSRLKKREKQIALQAPKEVSFGKKINIVLSFDDGYLKPACALLNSILSHTNNGKDIDFYILHDDSLSETVKKRLNIIYEGRTHIYFIKIDKSFVGDFPLNRKHININSYYRLLIHNNIPDNIERVIYLDTDLIICDDIVDLWNYDTQDYALAGIQDEEGVLESYRLFGKDFDHSYVNAGVLIFNLNIAKKHYGNLDFLYVESFYKFQNKINLQDQDILNIAYKGDIFVLPLRWNLSSASYKPQKVTHPCSGLEDGCAYAFTHEEEQVARLDPAILHYTGRRKPWKFLSVHYLKEFYWRYYVQTPDVRLSFKEKLCRWNHYLNIHRGVIHLTVLRCEYSWSLISILGYWKRKLLWWKK